MLTSGGRRWTSLAAVRAAPRRAVPAAPGVPHESRKHVPRGEPAARSTPATPTNDALRRHDCGFARCGLSEVNSPLITDGSSSERATSFAVRGRFGRILLHHLHESDRRAPAARRSARLAIGGGGSVSCAASSCCGVRPWNGGARRASRSRRRRARRDRRDDRCSGRRCLLGRHVRRRAERRADDVIVPLLAAVDCRRRAWRARVKRRWPWRRRNR